jgi:hypothetical protein
MDLGSSRRGGLSPGAGDSVESGSPIAMGEAIKHETEATAPLAATRANLNGMGGGISDASEAMEMMEADEMESVTKKRKTGTGSRGVANLTPEQLAKKRANGECLLRLFLFTTSALFAVHAIGSLASTTQPYYGLLLSILPFLELLHLDTSLAASLFKRDRLFVDVFLHPFSSVKALLTYVTFSPLI